MGTSKSNFNQHYLGVFEQKIDSKGRVSFPASFRNVVDFEPQQLLFHHPEENYLFGASASRMVETIRKNNKEALSLTASSGLCISLDKDGRVVIPADIRERCFEGQDHLVFAGVADFYEIWSPERWAAVKIERDKAVNDLRASL